MRDVADGGEQRRYGVGLLTCDDAATRTAMFARDFHSEKQAPANQAAKLAVPTKRIEERSLIQPFSLSRRSRTGAHVARRYSMMQTDNMMGGMWIGMVLVVLLGLAMIAALIALSIFLLRRSR
jgi:hypothetical protein